MLSHHELFQRRCHLTSKAKCLSGMAHTETEEKACKSRLAQKKPCLCPDGAIIMQMAHSYQSDLKRALFLTSNASGAAEKFTFPVYFDIH